MLTSFIEGSDIFSYKIPESVLVVIYTSAWDVLMIKRADATDFWQSVTGSKDTLAEAIVRTAAREVREETGIDCGPGTVLENKLCDWQLDNVYKIYPAWRHRYAPDVTHNREHLFGLQVSAGTPVRLSPHEHTAYQWLPWREAAAACFSPSNAEAILMLPRLAGGQV